MLMVVFGAGASYDSVPSRPPSAFPPSVLPDRPPLADELFGDRPRFVDAIRSFPRCQPIIPWLRHLPRDGSVEQVLEGLQAEAEEYPERHRQLAAVRFYLHLMLWECERYWNDVAKGVKNYKTLLDQLERWRKSKERICLVTFNYDTMLEAAVPAVGVEVRSLPDYIASDKYKVIKPHGSVNWARGVDTPIDASNKNTWQVAYELIDKAPDLKISQRYCMVTEHPIGKQNGSVFFPALAIPVQSKVHYECPPEHLDALRACIPEVTKLLLIGWRATEVPFRRLLAENLTKELRVMVVAGGLEQAREPIEKLQQAGMKGQFLAAKGGFTDFVVAREGDEFLKSGEPFFRRCRRQYQNPGSRQAAERLPGSKPSSH